MPNALGISCPRQRSYHTPPYRVLQRTVVQVGLAGMAGGQLHPVVGRHYKFSLLGYGDSKDYETKPERSRMIQAANSSHPK